MPKINKVTDDTIEVIEVTISTLSTVAGSVVEAIMKEKPRPFNVRIKKLEYTAPGMATITLEAADMADLFYLGLWAGFANQKGGIDA